MKAALAVSALLALARITTAQTDGPDSRRLPAWLRESAAASRSASRPDVVKAFASLFRFCPEQIETLQLETHEAEIEIEGHRIKARRGLRAYRRFVSLDGFFIGTAPHEHLTVHEVDAPPHWLFGTLRDSYTSHSIGGANCFVRNTPVAPSFTPGWGCSESPRSEEGWLALVDEKFLLLSNRKDFMREALEAPPGRSPAACIERLGWSLPDIPWAAPLIILRKFDRANPADRRSPINRGFTLDAILVVPEFPRMTITVKPRSNQAHLYLSGELDAPERCSLVADSRPSQSAHRFTCDYHETEERTFVFFAHTLALIGIGFMF